MTHESVKMKKAMMPTTHVMRPSIMKIFCHVLADPILSICKIPDASNPPNAPTDDADKLVIALENWSLNTPASGDATRKRDSRKTSSALGYQRER